MFLPPNPLLTPLTSDTHLPLASDEQLVNPRSSHPTREDDHRHDNEREYCEHEVALCIQRRITRIEV